MRRCSAEGVMRWFVGDTHVFQDLVNMLKLNCRLFVYNSELAC